MLEKIITTAKEAGDAILEFYNDDVEVMHKEDESPLTKADLAAHHIIIDALKELDPDTPVISEESGVPDYKDRSHWNKLWIVDPLDGTKEFIKKNDEFTVNIALVENGDPILGVVYVPVKDTIFYAQKGQGSFKKEGSNKAKPIFSENADKNNDLVAVQSRSHGSDRLVNKLKEEGLTVDQTIPAGSSLKFCLVAEGKADIYPRMGPTMEWDVAAGDCVYRYSAPDGVHSSPITYNKKDLKNTGFLIGIDGIDINV